MQRLRWIPPGRFQMGSPDDEPGRFADRESPQHWVEITRGFWMFDTPCCQDLWAAVMGKTPSRFKHPHRPVEKVSWEDCQQFFEKFAALDLGFRMNLPTEAEWEYACRAGTTDATYAGPMEIVERNNAPVLHDIGWYAGNCGVEFDLDEGADFSVVDSKQFEFDTCGTRIAAVREPNPWGLYDTLDNVLEWCKDGQRKYEDRAETDPLGSEEASALRVVRGGSWYNYARYCRAAYRGASHPSLRDDAIDFRPVVQ